MSVIIKGMKMPDRCLDCPFMISRDNDDCILQSGVANELAVTWDDLKSGCPLVEIPEKHGRLIDADEKRLRITLKGIREGECQIYKGGSWGFAAKAETAIDDAPTVFEAEGQE